MPGKVNPVVCEAVRQVCAQVIGNDAAVAFAGSQGEFELNVMLPVMGRNVLESIRLLAAVASLFADRCVHGLAANVEVARAYAEAHRLSSPAQPLPGYDRGTAVAKGARRG
jgi:fumarate hydratase class II